MEYAGELETHLTLAADLGEGIEDLRRFAERHGLKCLHIVLDRGLSVSQPMLTRRVTGTLSSELQNARDLALKLDRQGRPITRIKIEAAPFNADVPQTDADATDLPANQYFEHHVKLLLNSNADTTALTTIAERHDAHLSRNALRFRHDGQREHFVTQRCWQVGRETAERQLASLTGELTAGGWQIIDIESEFVIYDSNLAIDAGWIRATTHTGE